MLMTPGISTTKTTAPSLSQTVEPVDKGIQSQNSFFQRPKR